MGVDSSTELPHHFDDITNWPKTRVEAALKAYIDGEYDFGIDFSVVMNITGYEADDAKDLVKAHSKSDSGIINAITLLVSIISLGNSENRNEIGRLESIFDLMDFSHSAHISMDELTILLLCVGTSYSYILGIETAEDDTMDSTIITFSRRIYESLGKKSTQAITRDELVSWTKENVFSQGATTINDIFYRITTNPDAGESKTNATATN